MENKKRIYPSTQLVCCLKPIVLKTYLYLLGWQSQGTIKLYVKQIAKATKLTVEEVEVSIQTLEDIHLIDICKIDNIYCATLNAEQAQKYYNLPMSKVMESDGIKLAEKITWNVDEQKSSNDIDSMSRDDLKTLLLRIQASLNEKEQCEKLIKSNEPIENDLPF